MAQLHTILGTLQALNGLDGPKRLFWQELNYQRKNTPLSMRSWPERARVVMAEAPVFCASAGKTTPSTLSAVKHLCRRWLTAILTNPYQQAQYVCF